MCASEGECANKTVEPVAIPSFDLGAFNSGNAQHRNSLAQQVDETCRYTGFFSVHNTGLASDLIERTWSITRDFFDLEAEQKMRSAASDPACPRGYFPENSEALAKSLGKDSPPDRKESFGCGPLRAPANVIDSQNFDFHYGDNLWPSEPSAFRDIWMEYFDAMENLGTQVLQLIAVALNLPKDYFSPFHTYPMSALRGIRYPQCANLLRGQMGAGDHSDYGSITLLKPDAHVPGLEILLPSGAWFRAPKISSDAFIVNIGDMMARWTNERWVSTRHRVILPPEISATHFNHRQSLAFFYNTNYDSEITCIPTCLNQGESPKYASVKAGEYLMSRFRAAKNV